MIMLLILLLTQLYKIQQLRISTLLGPKVNFNILIWAIQITDLLQPASYGYIRERNVDDHFCMYTA